MTKYPGQIISSLEMLGIPKIILKSIDPDVEEDFDEFLFFIETLLLLALFDFTGIANVTLLDEEEEGVDDDDGIDDGIGEEEDVGAEDNNIEGFAVRIGEVDIEA